MRAVFYIGHFLIYFSISMGFYLIPENWNFPNNTVFPYLFGMILALTFLFSRVLEKKARERNDREWVRNAFLGLFLKLILSMILILVSYFISPDSLTESAFLLLALYLCFSFWDIFWIVNSGQKVGD